MTVEVTRRSIAPLKRRQWVFAFDERVEPFKIQALRNPKDKNIASATKERVFTA